MSETTTAPRTCRLTAREWKATRDKIDKINARAVKRGFTGRIETTATRVEVTETNSLGLEVTEIYWDVTVTGQAPCYGGWTFQAKLDWDEHAGLIVSTAPGVDDGVIDRDGLREGWCDHCRTNRHRAVTYLVANDAGQRRQVGSTCIKDFTGWAGRVVWIDEGAVDLEEMGFGRAVSDAWSVETVLAAAWASIMVRGYRSTSMPAATKEHVLALLRPRSAADLADCKELAPYIGHAARQASIIREWAVSEMEPNSDYARNLRAVAGAEFCSERNLGLLCSAPQAWARAQERDLARQREREELTNEWVGEVKQRLEVEVTVRSMRWIDGYWGTTCLYTLVSSDGHVFKWFSSKAGLGETADGTVYRLRGTVKKHEEYEGMKSTVLTRCTVLQTREPAEEQVPVAA